MKKHTLKMISALMILVFILFSIIGIPVASSKEAVEESIVLEEPTMHISYESQTEVEELLLMDNVYNTSILQKSKEPETVASFSIEEIQVVENKDELDDIGYYTITAYCPCEICCGDWANQRPNGIVYGAYGYELEEGVSVASPLPKGTKLKIEGLDSTYTVQDTTADWIVDRYDGRIIDVYFSNHKAAKEFHKINTKVYIVQEDNDDYSR
jgi:hypothetical protein